MVVFFGSFFCMRHIRALDRFGGGVCDFEWFWVKIESLSPQLILLISSSSSSFSAGKYS
jgi:hypothetical protein